MIKVGKFIINFRGYFYSKRPFPNTEGTDINGHFTKLPKALV